MSLFRQHCLALLNLFFGVHWVACRSLKDLKAKGESTREGPPHYSPPGRLVSNCRIWSSFHRRPVSTRVLQICFVISICYQLAGCGQQENSDIQKNIEALSDEDLQVRFEAEMALSQIGERALEPLIGLLQEEEIRTRKSAASAIVQVVKTINDPEVTLQVVSPLIMASSDITSAFPRDRDTQEMYGYIGMVLNSIGEPALIPVTEAFASDDVRIRRAAARTIPQMWNYDQEIFFLAIEDDDAVVKTIAAIETQSALSKADVPTRGRAVKPLVQALKSSDPNLRGAAGGTLGRLGEPALDPLLEVLFSEDQTTRLFAGGAIGGIVGTGEDIDLLHRAMDPVLEVYEDKESTPESRNQAAIALRSILQNVSDPSICERVSLPLIDALENESEELGLFAAGCLGSILSNVSDPEIGRRAIKPLIERLADPNEVLNVRAESANALGKIISANRSLEFVEAAMPPLIEALQAEPQILRFHASHAIGDIASTVDGPELHRRVVPALIDSLQDNDRIVLEHVLESLGKVLAISEDRTLALSTVDPLIQVLENNDQRVRERAAWVLSEIDTTSAREALRISGVKRSPPPVRNY